MHDGVTGFFEPLTNKPARGPFVNPLRRRSHERECNGGTEQGNFFSG